MTPDLLYRVSDVPEGLRASVDAELPDAVTVHAGVLPVDARAPYVLLTARAPHLEGPMMAGDQTNDLTLSATCVGLNVANAAQTADLVRQILTGRDGRGAFTVELALTGRVVLKRECNYDGTPDIVQGVPQWTETYQLLIGRSSL